MKKIFKALLPTCFILFVAFTMIGCDKDFSSIESDVIGEDNANFETPDRLISIKAYNKKLDSVQISNLAATLLGVYDDPSYGRTTAGFVAQIIPTTFTTLGTKPAIDSVVLTIPYYSTVTGTKTRIDGNAGSVYALDSLYGDSKDPIKLSIFQNKYLLRSFKPGAGFDIPQRYYSNAYNADKTINTAITEAGLINFDSQKEASIIYEDTLSFRNNEIGLEQGSGDTKTYEFLAPSLRVQLDTMVWHTEIIKKQGTSALSNANNFLNHFRGLYFKVETYNNKGSMVLLNLANSGANIVIYYSKDTSDTDATRTQSTYTLGFTGNKVNTFINDFNLPLENGNKTDGDETLYLKNSGSMAVVDLFPGPLNDKGVPVELAALRDEFNNGVNPNTLINEAQLIVYENLASSLDTHTYDRIYAYDIKNKISLIDYSFDQTTNTTNPVFSKFVHLGTRIEDAKRPGVWKYKIRITEHLNNLIFKDSTNTKIGLVISNNVNYTNNALILNSGDGVTAIPAAAVISPRGTILYGSNESVDTDLRMTLKLFFTKPK